MTTLPLDPALALLAGETPAFFGEVAGMVLVGAAIAYLCQRLGLMPIVGFLVAGVLIGPSALGVVKQRELVDAVAELGVILLLFTIGIEFSLERLNRMRALIFGAGALQVALTVAAVTGCLLLGGVGWQRRGVYDELIVAEITAALQEIPAGSVDMANSVDTLIYFGDLGPVFAGLHRALKPGGAFIATVESHADDDPRGGATILASGRYSHSAAHIRAAAGDAGLNVHAINPVVLRMEYGQPVAGYVFLIENQP
jgi:SAM-dependent methyltransferase